MVAKFQKVFYFYILFTVSSIIPDVESQIDGIARQFYLDDFVPEVLIPINWKTTQDTNEYRIKLHGEITDPEFRISLSFHEASMTEGNDLLVSSRLYNVDGTSAWINHTWTLYDGNEKAEVVDAVEIVVKIVGTWNEGSADLLATAYYEVNSTSWCRGGYFKCYDKDCGRRTENNESGEMFRCVRQSLECNLRRNCGPRCSHRVDYACFDDSPSDSCALAGLWIFFAIVGISASAIGISCCCLCSYGCCGRKHKKRK